jgi:exodeoxyribonuclease V alpha subunit
MRADPADAPDLALATVFARHCERWSAERGAAPAIVKAVRQAAEGLSLATSNGQVCLLLEELPRDEGLPASNTAWRAALLASGIVGSADAPGSLPLTLDDDGRLYLQRFFDLERRLAARLWQAASAPPRPLGAADRARLDARFGGPSAASAESAAPPSPVTPTQPAEGANAPLAATAPAPSPAKAARRKPKPDDGQIDWLTQLAPEPTPAAGPAATASTAASATAAAAAPAAATAAVTATASATSTTTGSAPATGPATDIDWQKAAAALALRQRLVVLSGGPGTGKTTAVVNLLACLVEQQPGCRIALAAPTGKAAARMAEALRQRALHLPAALRDQLPTEAFTVHRLLGTAPGMVPAAAGMAGAGSTGGTTASLLPIDVLIVDEASMLDLALATRLVEALPADARLVLLGDKDQLAAVESGAVFAELSADPRLSEAAAHEIAAVCGVAPAAVTAALPGPSQHPSALRDSVVWLQRNFRFAAGTGIGRLAAEISSGRASDALATLRDPAQAASLRWLDDGGTTPPATPSTTLSAATLQSIAAGYAEHFAAVRQDPTDAAAVAAAFSRYRVLCALRTGPRGVQAVNEHAGRLAQAALDIGPPGTPLPTWYAGRPVMVLRNDYLLKLFNGDIGIALPGPDGALAVHFPDTGGGWRRIAPARLPPHETAYAMTVHKSQGSEFDGVLVLLPEHRSRVLTRELLYTGVTRARERVAIAASADVLAATIGAATHRHSGLLARLRALQAASPRA